MNGWFITFEGGEGGGKTTQIALLKTFLESLGFDVVVTREPGGTSIAERIRTVLLDPQNTGMDSTAELLLYAAARAQHVGELIAPALQQGKVVLCDRFCDSTTAYQGAGRSLLPEDLDALHQIATHGLIPDLTLFMDLPAEIGLKRAKGDTLGDRIEKESIVFHQRVRDGFIALAERFPERIVRIDALQSIEQVTDNVRSIVSSRMNLEGH